MLEPWHVPCSGDAMRDPALSSLLIFAGVALSRCCAGAAVTPEFIYGMPKAELHIHLEGSIDPEEYIGLVARNNLQSAYGTAEAVRLRLRHATNLDTFIEVYQEMLASMRTERDFHDVALACFEHLHAQHVVHVEMFFDPQMHTTRGIPFSTVMEGIDSARSEAEGRLGMTIGYIMCFNRNRTAASAMEILEASKPWLPRILGIGLDNNEEAGFPEKFKGIFARAGQLGLHRTAHCDVNQAHSVDHIWGCLQLLGVERIDHGVNVLDDPRLIETVKARRIGLTVCPTLLYTEIPGRLEFRAKAIKRMLDLGLLVTVNSDDPGIMRGLYVSDLMAKVQVAAQLSRDDVVALARNSFLISWIPDSERKLDLRMLDDYVASHPQ
jgi:adenosine deaminase